MRIVVVPGYDTCACCAPHVKRTGEIGLIKLTGLQNYKGGVRVSMLCGFRALADYEEKAESVKRLSVMLSAKENEVAEEVQRLKEELTAQKGKLARLEGKLLEQKVGELEKNQKLVVLFESDLAGNAPRELVNRILCKGTEIAAVFAGTPANGYRYVVGSKTLDVRPFAKRLNERFQGRGGGKPEMVQGSLGVGEERKIREEVESCSREI